MLTSCLDAIPRRGRRGGTREAGACWALASRNDPGSTKAPALAHSSARQYGTRDTARRGMIAHRSANTGGGGGRLPLDVFRGQIPPTGGFAALWALRHTPSRFKPEPEFVAAARAAEVPVPLGF